ncbi:hypothetical protein [Streptomyces sp. NPDC048659]|uniref:hypothetical protein n=1 Tax=Streptomyces sp. NPDC048659 TaxID=3155489 RepID=UPI00341FF314
MRCWESGRSAPRGARRRAYAEFLNGLAVLELRSPAARGPAIEPASGAAPSWYPARAVPVGRPVRPVRADPVSEPRLRRWRRAAVAAGCWTLVLQLLLTVPVVG